MDESQLGRGGPGIHQPPANSPHASWAAALIRPGRRVGNCPVLLEKFSSRSCWLGCVCTCGACVCTRRGVLCDVCVRVWCVCVCVCTMRCVVWFVCVCVCTMRCVVCCVCGVYVGGVHLRVGALPACPYSPAAPGGGMRFCAGGRGRGLALGAAGSVPLLPTSVLDTLMLVTATAAGGTQVIPGICPVPRSLRPILQPRLLSQMSPHPGRQEKWRWQHGGHCLEGFPGQGFGGSLERTP